MDVTIRRLEESDAEAYAALRRQSLEDEPLAFASSPEDDAAGDPQKVRGLLARGPGSVIFGAFDDGEAGDGLVGAVGIYRDRHRKAAHRMHIWGMYVVAPYRGKGVGLQLLQAALRRATATPGVDWVHLGVSTSATAARRLYESEGFIPWGTEPDVLRHGGRAVSELHMALQLE